MADPKKTPKPTLLAGFDWAETVRKAGEQGPAAKAQAAPSRPGAPARASHGAGAPKPGKGAGPKSQQRLRVKV
jgi:hypothetical protein